MIDMRHPLAVLATRMPWATIEASLAPVLAHKERDGRLVQDADLFGPTAQLAGAGPSNAGRPRLPIRLMVALLYLKHAFNLSDEELCQRWSENVVWQFFSGMAYYEPRLPCDATQIGRFRRVLGEAGVEQLLKSTIEASVSMGVVKKTEFERIIVDTTVQEKAIAHPTDSRLLEIARHKVASAAKRCGIALKQTFAKQGKELRRKAGGYAHAKQFKRLRRTLKRQPRPSLTSGSAAWTKSWHRCRSSIAASSSLWMRSSDAGSSGARRSSRPSVTPRATTAWIAAGSVAAVVTRCMRCYVRQDSTSAGYCARLPPRGWRPFSWPARNWRCMRHASPACHESPHLPPGDQLGNSSGFAGRSPRVCR
jgi:hypothetical protein